MLKNTTTGELGGLPATFSKREAEFTSFFLHCLAQLRSLQIRCRDALF